MKKNIIIIRQIKDSLLRLFTYIYGIFHPIKKQILFVSYGTFVYADSGREISEQMHSLFPDYKLVWLLNDKLDNYDIVPSYVDIIFIKSKLTFYKELAKSFCFVYNEIFTPNIHKRKNQFFIQTWHGDRPFKKVVYEEKLSNDKIYNRYIDNKLVDICIAGSDKGSIQYREAFRYNGKIVQNGMPRNDKLITGKFDSAIIKNRLNLSVNCKILLYAPTYRDNVIGKQNVVVDLSRTLKVLQKKYPYDYWICLVRAHCSSKGFNVKEQNCSFIDVSNYPDMSDLLCITDILITDYSSCAGDFVLTKRPVILTVFDMGEYQKNCRSFKYRLEDTGFMLAHSQTELENIICSLTKEKIQLHYNMVMNFFGITENGHSAEKICEYINNFYKKHFEKKN